jgi:hypothetical protein
MAVMLSAFVFLGIHFSPVVFATVLQQSYLVRFLTQKPVTCQQPTSMFCLQDWRTYPAARFISEYGWQSYPSWATYSAATAAQDWTVAADMTEFR